MPDSHVPRATYRVQLTPEFGFAAARRIVPYLHALGITDLYCSPILTARSGSQHGYDVTNPHEINPELGGRAEFEALAAALRERGMGLLLDIVPNHMAASVENPWWADVLESGIASPYAGYFDIEWDSALANGVLENRVLLPILGAPYGQTLENGELRLALADDRIVLRYFETALPLSLASYRLILRWHLHALDVALSGGPALSHQYSSLLEQLDRLSADQDTEPAARIHLRRSLLAELRRLLGVPVIREHLERALTAINGRPGQPRSFDLLDRIIGEQAYRLAFWELARERINYRRFFDVNDLVAIRVEEQAVFADTHRLILELASARLVTGLRIDHIDGLRDPLGYLVRLREALVEADADDCYLVVEKILAPGEDLPPDWPIAGTTGYDFLNQLGGLFVDRAGDPALDAIYRRWSGLSLDFPELAYQQKRRVLDELFAGSVNALSLWLDQIAESDRHGRDLPLASLRQALVELTASLPIYRTYIRDFNVAPADRRWIERALADAARARPDLSHALSFLRRLLLQELPVSPREKERTERLSFVLSWQQFTSPVMAKGYEDTALYIYNRLVAQNEVGGHPEAPGVTPAEFHDYVLARQERWPGSMNASSTHDTKRGEDVRARLVVLSQIAGEWESRLDRWAALNADKRTVIDDQPVPGGNTELLIYQTLLGAWPLEDAELPGFPGRVKDYLVKASREAKTHTGWTAPNLAYEAALAAFVDRLLDAAESRDFLADFRPFQARLAFWGALTSLSQLLIKLTAPGVPDSYQGNELWALNLVDPDNRRPVDYARREQMLASLTAEAPPDPAALLRDWRDGRVKLWLTWRLLALRAACPALFRDGDYLPIAVEGEHAQHLLAFLRRHDAAWALLVAPRLMAELAPPEEFPIGGVWGDTVLRLSENAPVAWDSFLTGERLVGDGTRAVPVARLLARAPFGVWLSGVVAAGVAGIR
ncbi:MAG TPA: malto-oligosyltrehalose synthase [Thermomicrobiaceae bacterium]|nr:malto-oligosyltrehalose synthase [Thermomicrobiaceae bacterium]